MLYTRPLHYALPLIRGEDVRRVQTALVVVATDPPCGAPDAIYGSMTQAAVKSFQRKVNNDRGGGAQPLDMDGVVGPNTWAALFDAIDTSKAPSPSLRRAAADLPPPSPGQTERPPINKAQAQRVKRWLTDNFQAEIDTAFAGTPIGMDLITGVAGKETAARWLGRIDHQSAAEVLAHCVFDASGDFPGTSRSAFPSNTAAFRARYGDGPTDALIAEANASRALDGFGPKAWVYKGYGPFQYDLQHVREDPDFFFDRQWCGMGACLAKLKTVLLEKIDQAGGDMRKAIASYNGSGARAQVYADHVLQIAQWAGEP